MNNLIINYSSDDDFININYLNTNSSQNIIISDSSDNIIKSDLSDNIIKSDLSDNIIDLLNNIDYIRNNNINIKYNFIIFKNIIITILSHFIPSDSTILINLINSIILDNNIINTINILFILHSYLIIFFIPLSSVILENLFNNIIIHNNYLDISVFNLYLKTFCNHKFISKFNITKPSNINQILLIISKHINNANYLYFINNQSSDNVNFLINFITKSKNKNNSSKLVSALHLYHKFENNFNELYNNLLIFISLNIYEAYYYLSLFENNPKYNLELITIGSDNNNITCSIALAEYYHKNNNNVSALNLLSKSLLLLNNNNKNINRINIIQEIISNISKNNNNNKNNNISDYINNLFNKIFYN